jgi:hypothetical protein
MQNRIQFWSKVEKNVCRCSVGFFDSNKDDMKAIKIEDCTK